LIVWRSKMAATFEWLEQASRSRRWLVGVSGGADSVALAAMLSEHGFDRAVICHLDHRLRGRDSSADAKWVAHLAAKLALPFEDGKIDVRSRMRQNGESLESAARAARHDFFGQCAKKWRCRRLILAHHAEDQAETVLWNLLRGSYGARGMSAQPRILNMGGVPIEIHRPLLTWRREEIRDWLQSRNLSWREDASNATPIAIRNRLRNEILPQLAEITGRDPTEMLCRAATADEDLREITRWAVQHAAATDPQGRLHLTAIRKLPKSLQSAVIANFLQSHGLEILTRDLLNRCVGLLDPASPPAVNLPQNNSLRRRAGRLFLSQSPPRTQGNESS
jgi:tRNA(Ile)-lysidine synthase